MLFNMHFVRFGSEEAPVHQYRNAYAAGPEEFDPEELFGFMFGLRPMRGTGCTVYVRRFQAFCRASLISENPTGYCYVCVRARVCMQPAVVDGGSICTDTPPPCVLRFI